MDNKNKLIKKYELYIFNKYQDLLKSGKNKDRLNNLELVKKYIDENNKRPSTTDKNNNTKHLGQWISDQQKKYKKT